MGIQIEKLMRKFKYDDKRISHLLSTYDDFVIFIRDYNDEFDLDNKDDDLNMLGGYRNSAFGILLALFQLGHITTGDFHHRLHALNTVYYNRMGY